MATREDLVDELLRDWKRERPDLDASSMAVVGRIVHLSGHFETQANEALKEFSLRYTDFDVLATLRRSGPPYKLTPTALRQSVLITSGAMTACLDRLERAGFLTREPDPQDRRGTRVRMTARGRNLVDKAVPHRFEVASDAIAKLTKTERARLSTLLRKLSLACS